MKTEDRSLKEAALKSVRKDEYEFARQVRRRRHSWQKEQYVQRNGDI